MSNPNDPAFPVDPETQKYQTAATGWLLAGLTKREYFAAMAMQGLLCGSQGETQWHEKNFAIGAINIADALIAELNKGTK